MDDTRSFWASDGRVVRPECDCGEFDYSLGEARDMLTELTAAIADAEQQTATIVAACADGHDWGSYMNMWHFWPDTKVCVRYCKRDGCDGRIEEPGWVEFAGRLHYQPISPRTARRVDCYGPGCEHCDNEKLAAEMVRILADGRATIEEAVLGSAFQKDRPA